MDYNIYKKKAQRRMLMKIVKWILIAMDILYIPAVFFIPALHSLKHDLLCWILYAAFLLFSIFVAGLPRKHEYTVTEEENRELDITKELLKDRNKWHI